MRALISVDPGADVLPLVATLVNAGFEIISTPETGGVIRETGLPCSITREDLRRIYLHETSIVVVSFREMRPGSNGSENLGIDRLDADRCALATFILANHQSVAIISHSCEYGAVAEEIRESNSLSDQTRLKQALMTSLRLSEWNNQVERILRKKVEALKVALAK